MKKIKFLLGALSFMAAAFMASPSQAQVTKTYLSEDFSQGLNPAVWNVNACTNISDEIGPLYFLQTQDGSVWGGWVYDPTGIILEKGAPDQLDGTYEIVANSIQLENNAINIVTVEYMYAAQSTGTRSFGVRVREEGGSEWTEVGKLSSLSSSGKLVATLDSKWDGKKVEMEVYFSAVHKANSAYYFLMGGVEFAAYAKAPAVSTKLLAAPVAYGKEFDFRMTIANSGALSVSSVDYSYSIDNGAKTGTLPTIEFGKALAPITGMAEGWMSIDIDGLNNGDHSFELRPSKINGEEVTATAEKLSFHLVDESKLNQRYVPLFEGFTASTCAPCATANGYFNPVLEELQNAGAINVIKYQMNFPGNGDPYYLAGNTTRMEYYDALFGWDGYWGVPTPIYNGMENVMDFDAQYWSDITDLLKEKATKDHNKRAVMDLDITKINIDENSNKAEVSLNITPNLALKGRVFVVLVEKTTTGNRGTNGEKEFHNVNMKFINGAAGVEKTFEVGKTETFNYSTSLRNSKIEEMDDLEVVCFIQHETGYIIQSARANSKNVANEGEVMGDVRVYPNPASEFVNITNLDGADVEIFDLTGRRVYNNSKVEGNLEIALTSFANGTYVVRLTKDGQSAHRKLIVVR